MSVLLPWALLSALALLIFLRRPLLRLLQLLLRSLGGLAVLALLSPLNLSIGVNWLNALVLGLLGIPGLGLLLLLPWLTLSP